MHRSEQLHGLLDEALVSLDLLRLGGELGLRVGDHVECHGRRSAESHDDAHRRSTGNREDL
jgi:hypothetical protein